MNTLMVPTSQGPLGHGSSLEEFTARCAVFEGAGVDVSVAAALPAALRVV